MDCPETFQEAAASAAPCEKVAQAKPGCACEAESVSVHSPGVVDGSEILARLIYSPHHVDRETGLTTELAFSDVQDKGLSVQRMAHATGADITAVGKRKLANDHARGKTDREFLGVVTGSVEAIRAEIYQEGARSFCVYDTGRPQDTAHADVCQTTATRSKMKRARKQLRDLFGRKPSMP